MTIATKRYGQTPMFLLRRSPDKKAASISVAL
jgi:hypothetical protein